MRTGSPINAEVKGQHEAEYAWFSIADAVPGFSIAAERAADQILSACAYGDPELTITLMARTAVLLNALAPDAMARVMMLTSQLLPGPNGSEGNRGRLGRESESKWAPSIATTLSDRAAIVNNET